MKKSEKDLINSALRYKIAKDKAANAKNDFDIEAEKYFANNSEKNSFVFESEGLQVGTQGLKVSHIKVNKTARSNIVFDLKKLKRALSKKVYDDIVDKSYTINDMPGLIAYLKECGVNPKIFKTFVSKSENVNQERINELSDLGKISYEDIKGCFKVKTGKPYYNVYIK